MSIKKSFILSSVFILASSFFLLVTPLTGYAQPISNCCFSQSNESPGCDNLACEELICDQDGFCCDVEWDSICASAAIEQCEVCMQEPLFAISLEPLEATNPLFTDHTVTATVLENGIPVEGIFVVFDVISGPNIGISSLDGDGECSPEDCGTDANGQISWTYSSSLEGVDTILATLQSSEASNEVQKEWIIVRNIPTLSEWGMISAAAVLGLIGIIAIRRRKVVS